MYRELLEQTCNDILIGSMEYNGETTTVYEETAQQTDETLINFLCEWIQEMIY